MVAPTKRSARGLLGGQGRGGRARGDHSIDRGGMKQAQSLEPRTGSRPGSNQPNRSRLKVKMAVQIAKSTTSDGHGRRMGVEVSCFIVAVRPAWIRGSRARGQWMVARNGTWRCVLGKQSQRLLMLLVALPLGWLGGCRSTGADASAVSGALDREVAVGEPDNGEQRSGGRAGGDQNSRGTPLASAGREDGLEEPGLEESKMTAGVAGNWAGTGFVFLASELLIRGAGRPLGGDAHQVSIKIAERQSSTEEFDAEIWLFDTAYEVSVIGACTPSDLLIAGLAANGEVVIEKWRLEAQQGAWMPSVPSIGSAGSVRVALHGSQYVPIANRTVPPRVRRIELYRGAGLRAVLSLVSTPGASHAYLLAKDSVGEQVLATLPLTGGGAPVIAATSAQLPHLWLATSLRAWLDQDSLDPVLTLSTSGTVEALPGVMVAWEGLEIVRDFAGDGVLDVFEDCPDNQTFWTSFYPTLVDPTGVW